MAWITKQHKGSSRAEPGNVSARSWRSTFGEMASNRRKKKRKRKKKRQSAIHEETRRICECRRDVGMHCQWKKVGLHEGVENKVGKTLLAKNEERDGAQPVVLGLQTGAFVVFFPMHRGKSSQTYAKGLYLLRGSPVILIYHVPTAALHRRNGHIMEMNTHYSALQILHCCSIWSSCF